MAKYSRDPYWLAARYPGTCHRCEGKISKGEQVFYYPNGKRLFCKAESCGGECSREFQAAAFDERMA
jgi:hypothetical protein